MYRTEWTKYALELRLMCFLHSFLCDKRARRPVSVPSRNSFLRFTGNHTNMTTKACFRRTNFWNMTVEHLVRSSVHIVARHLQNGRHGNLSATEKLIHYDTMAVCFCADIVLCYKSQLIYRRPLYNIPLAWKYSKLTNDEKNNKNILTS